MSWMRRCNRCKTTRPCGAPRFSLLPPGGDEKIVEQKLIPCKIEEIKPLVAPLSLIFFIRPKYGAIKGEVG